MLITQSNKTSLYLICSTFLLILMMIYPNRTVAQNELLEIVEYDNVKNQLFIQFPVINGDTIAEYSLDNRNNFLDLQKEQNFTQKNNITINVGWLNPINFKVSIEDTLIADPASKVISDFISNLTGQFGIAPFEPKDAGGGAASFVRTPVAFNDLDLAQWMNEFQQVYNGANAEQQKRMTIVMNRIKDELIAIDMYLAYDFATNSVDIFNNLKAISDPYTIRNKSGSYKLASDGLADLQTPHAKAVTGLGKLISQLTTNENEIKGDLSFNKAFEYYTLAFLKMYIAESKSKIEARTKSIDSLIKIVKLLDKSVTGQTLIEKENSIFIKLTDVKRLRGKITQVEMTLKRYKYANNDLSKKSETVQSKYLLSFQSYRFFIPSVSVGVFYSSLKHTTFEAGVDNTGNTIVEESTQENGPVYATNLNFYLNTKNSDLLPFFQLGIDPTKERPFLLVGAGIAIPDSRFALSGGFAWTWNQSLKTLSVNGTADSSAAIKDDIEYAFNKNPKIYFGLQYNFK